MTKEMVEPGVNEPRISERPVVTTDMNRGERHIGCLMPTYVDGGDSTICYYVDGTHEVILKPMKVVLRDIAAREGLSMTYLKNSDGDKPMYTDPRTYGPHMTFAYLKVRQPVGRDTAYGQFNVIVPYDYRITEGPTADSCYVGIGPTQDVLVFHSMQHVRRKLREALLEHMAYVRRFLEKLGNSENKYVISELYAAWRNLGHKP